MFDARTDTDTGSLYDRLSLVWESQCREQNTSIMERTRGKYNRYVVMENVCVVLLYAKL